MVEPTQTAHRIDGAEPVRRRLADLAVAVWRERKILLGVLAACVAVGVVAAFLQRPVYDAQARVLIRLGQEYVFQPQVGAAGAGAFPLLQQVVNAETNLLSSPEIARRLVAKLTPQEIVADARGADAVRVAERAFATRFEINTTPETPIITLTYSDENPQRAAKILNAAIDEYFAYRREVLVERGEGGFAEQAQAFEARAQQAAADVQAFLARHGVGDFDAELKAVGELQSRLDGELADARARRGELEGQAAALGARTRAQPAEIELYADSDAQRQLVDLRLQRAQLTARYLDTAPPVREIDGRIAELEAAVAQAGASATRRGPNPVRQQIETQFIEIESNARAQASRASALETQRNQALARLRLLQQIEPDYRQLMRDRTILEDNARQFRVRAEETEALSELAGLRSDTVRRMETASAPTQGRSSRLIIALGSVLFGLVAGLTAALLRGVTRDVLVSPSDAARRLRLPVLAVSPKMAPAGVPS